MDRYLSVAEMISIEKAADAMGHTYAKMMAFAGKSLAEAILNFYGHLEKPPVLGLVGSGNNGGDALVALKLLLDIGWECTAYLTSDRVGDELLVNFVEAGGKVSQISDDEHYHQLRGLVIDCDLLVDGLLGTGIRLPLRAPISEVLEIVGDSLDQSDPRPKIVAVDCPSGIDCDHGNAGKECLHADLTVCMAAVKQGLLKLPAYAYLGHLIVGNIGLPEDLPELKSVNRYVLDQEYVNSVLPERTLDSYKGTFGTVLVIAGSKNLPGAALLAGKAAFRSGAGWVNMAVLENLQPHLIGAFPEATWLPLRGNSYGFILENAQEILDSLSKETAILLGPGLGMGVGVQEFLGELISENLPPLIIDADGLKILSDLEEWWKKIPEKSILTPHPGEMSALTGLSSKEIQDNRIAVTEQYARLWGHIVVLKGAFTVVTDPDGKTVILPVATAALARAGAGDVLAGLISGLRAQGIPAFDSAAAGVWLHAQAGLAAAEVQGSTAGVLAGDLIDMLPGLLPF
jgi:NAD(P)H-hydrate epimerase